MDKEQKKELRWNVIKFIIGIILLCMCWWYLQWHPAEKTSVFSWFEVLRQKAEVVRQNMIWKNWDLLEDKYSMEKYYKELITMAEWNNCITADQFDELEELYENLQNEDNENLANVLPEYTKKAYIFEAIVQENNC